MVEEEPVYRLTEAELDNLFQELLLTESPEFGPNHYTEAYQSGKEDGIRQFHKELENRANIVIE